MLSIQAKLLVENEKFVRFGKKDPKKQQDKINSKKKKKQKQKNKNKNTHNKQTDKNCGILSYASASFLRGIR